MCIEKMGSLFIIYYNAKNKTISSVLVLGLVKIILLSFLKMLKLNYTINKYIYIIIRNNKSQ